jgi:hypothetical protein
MAISAILSKNNLFKEASIDLFYHLMKKLMETFCAPSGTKLELTLLDQSASMKKK